MTKVFIEATKLVEKTGGELTPEQMEHFDFLAMGFNNQEREEGERVLRETIVQKINYRGSKFFK